MTATRPRCFNGLRRWFGRSKSTLGGCSGASLEGNGERVDILFQQGMDMEGMDIYQRSHYERYRFASGQLTGKMVCGDFACGTGYGSVMLAAKAERVVGGDIDKTVLEAVRRRYARVRNVEFVCLDVRRLTYDALFDLIVSFETIEHLPEPDILLALRRFWAGLKQDGRLLLSLPYMQPATPTAKSMGFHRTFLIDEKRLLDWLGTTGFVAESILYQSYAAHRVVATPGQKDFLVCVARRTAEVGDR